MNSLWQRYAAVTLGDKTDGRGKKYDGLKMVFQVEKNSESNANTAKISIYNLSRAGRSLAEKQNAFVLLEVGYAGSCEQLFVGDITRAYISRQGPDVVTTVECGDGANALRSVHIDKSYAPGTDLKNVIRDVAQSFVDQGKVVIGSMAGIKSEKAQSGLALSGSSQTILDDLARKQGLEWSIQDNELQLLPEQTGLGRTAVMISSQTGLIGSAVRRETTGGEAVEFTALIQTQLIPGCMVRIVSQVVTGFYKLKAVNFFGDTHGQAFYAKGQAVGL